MTIQTPETVSLFVEQKVLQQNMYCGHLCITYILLLVWLGVANAECFKMPFLNKSSNRTGNHVHEEHCSLSIYKHILSISQQK
jgi:hypothetical protein